MIAAPGLDAEECLKLLKQSGGSRQLVTRIETRIADLESGNIHDERVRELREAWKITRALSLEVGRLEAAIQRRDFQARLRDVELEAVYQLGRVLAATFEVERLMETVLDLAVTISNARCGALWLHESGTWRTVGVVGNAEVELGTCLPESQPLPESQLLPGATHRLAVPIASERGVLGYLLVGDQERRRGIGPFRPEDRRTLELLANQAAVALENAGLHRQAVAQELLEREMQLAFEMQRRILPESLPEVAGFELWAWNRPARHVSGDYFQFFHDPGSDCLRLALGDVSGKGVPAALLVSLLHSALVLLWDQSGLGEELFVRLNRHLFLSSAESKFVTLVLAELDRPSGSLVFLNAGHPPGLLVRRDGSMEELPSGGLPLGLFPSGSWQVSSRSLDPGDLICLYTDGVIEAEAPFGEEFGVGRLAALLLQGRQTPLQELGPRIASELEAYSGGGALSDDGTLLLLRRQPEGSATLSESSVPS